MQSWIRQAQVWTVVAALIMTASSLAAQVGPAGRWDGSIVIQSVNLAIVVRIDQKDGTLAGTIDIPQQGAAGLALTALRHEGAAVHFELVAGPGVAVFEGKLEGDAITGSFTQGPASGTFSLKRGGAAPAAAPTPVEPPPYAVNDVTFSNGAITIAGTLTVPKAGARVPAVVLISGSGAQDRDETVAGFKVFAVLADHLTRQGIAVLRTDDRGVGGTTGSTPDSTTADFAGDALAAVAFLKNRPEIDPARIGLCGHSEGGLVAPLAATKSKDVAFIVLLAGPALTGERIMLAQAAAIGQARGASPATIEKNAAVQRRLFAAVRAGTVTALRPELRQEGLAQIAALPEAQRAAVGDPGAYIDRALDAELKMVASPWFRYFLDYDPLPVLEAVRCPMLALYGEKDLQVVPLAENRSALEAALAKSGNRALTVAVVPAANHLFQEAKSGSPDEYTRLAKTFAPGFLDTVTAWIRTTTPRK